jgi:hypothetical protein
MMLFLHLFNTLDYQGLFEPLIYIGSKPFVYYLSLFCDACVPVFAFVSGYGLYFKYQQNQSTYWKDNGNRLKKLYVNYWIILLFFPLGLGLLLNKEGYPGSLCTFIGNGSGLFTSYNGAWWFFTIYILFVVSSSLWFELFNLINPYGYFFILIVVYIGCFYLRVYQPASHIDPFLNMIQTQLVLYGCTLFQFMLGAFALRFSWNKVISKLSSRIKRKDLLFFSGTAVLILIHAAIPNFVIAPLTGLLFLFLFTQVQPSKLCTTLLDFLTPHATNMWLVHMFFYAIFFKSFIYSSTYVLAIFLVLVSCSICSSMIINTVYNPILKALK